MNNYVYSDLALENFGFFGLDINDLDPTAIRGIRVSAVKIDSVEKAKKYGCRQGSYVTVFCKKISTLNALDLDRLTDTVSEQIKALIENKLGCAIKKDTRALVVGLGNADMVADAIGPMTVKRITVTGDTDSFDDRCRVFALEAGVKGATGMESASTVIAVARECRPDFILAVDALAARDTSRLAATVQITDNGISPGSGIYNARREISENTVSAPVIAIGVPTVVDSATLIYDELLSSGIKSFGEDIYRRLDIRKGFFVSPKDCDIISRCASSMLAAAIDKSLGI